MAKIKFNLNFGGEQIRTLDDLRDNFSIEDILEVYNNGLLVKWLDVHNHKAELEQVNAIHATDARGILSELIRIFGISDDPSEIQESLSVLDYLEERKKAHEDMKAHSIPDYEKVKKERDDLARQVEELKELLEAKATEAEIREEAPKPAKKSYDELVQEIIDNHLDLHHIYDCLDAITTDYPDILKEKYSELFNRLYESKPHTIIPLFAHHGTRPYYTIDNSKLKDATFGVNYVDGDKTIKIFDTTWSGSFQNYNNPTWWPSELLEKVNFLSVLNRFMYSIFEESDEVITGRYPYIKIVRRKAVANWFAVEPPSKNFMILSRLNNRDYQASFSCTGTYAHHSADNELKTKGEYIPVLLPVVEGIDVKGKHFEMRMAYVEAR